jgi:hypothetical protein
MKDKIKLWLRRWAIRQLIKLVDGAEERLQRWQVSLREKIAPKPLAAEDQALPRHHSPVDRTPLPAGETFLQWEARKSGVAPVSKKVARRRRERMTAAAFDLKFAER